MTAPPDAVAPTGITQVALTVRDLDRAVAFYRDVLGLRFLFRADPSMAFFDCGGVRLLLGHESVGGPRPPRSMVYYRVDDIQAATGRLRSHGVDVGKGPAMIARVAGRETWLLEFEDSEGNAAGLMCERAVVP